VQTEIPELVLKLNMDKESTISYKVYPNERLKQVLFHGKEMYPLYIQVIYDRKPIYFKSYFFDLLSKEKYAIHYIGGKKPPVQKEVIVKEENVLRYLIEQKNKKFSLDALQKDYYYYSKDLLNLVDDGFKDYLIGFFEDQGQPEIAMLIDSAREKIMSSNLMHGFKSALKPHLFKLLLESVSYYGPSYLPFQDFIEKKRRESFYTFSVYEWEQYQHQFESFLKKDYPNYSFENVQASMKKLIER
jgi:hypothetical protein